MLERYVRLVAHRPRWTLAAIAAVTFFFALQLVDLRTLAPRLLVQTEIEKVLPEQGEYRDFYAHFRTLFGNYEMVFVGVTGAEVFTPEGLERIQRLTRELERIDGVRRVLSLANAPGIRSEGGDLRIASAYDEIPRDAAGLAEIRDRVLADPMLAGNLVSQDGQATALLVYPDEMSEREFRRRRIDHEIERVARAEVGDAARVLMAGNPALKATTGRILLRDLVRLVPLSFLFMGLIAFYAFRSLPGVAIPLLSIGLAQVWTAGTMVLFDRSLNLVTFIVPILINAVGFADSIHLIAEHDEAVEEGHRGGDAAARAVRQVAFPVFFAAATTVAGFVSLWSNPLPAIREFGAFCIVGVVASFVIAMTMGPAILSLAGRRPRSARTSEFAERVDRWAERLAVFDIRHRRALFAASALVTVIALYGVTRIVVSTSFVTNLAETNPIRMSSEAFDRELGGSTTFHVVVEGGSPDLFKQPENLRMLRSLQTWLGEQPEVSKTTSLADYLMQVNRAFRGGDPEGFVLPDSKRTISQFLFFFWYRGLEDLVTPGFSDAHIMIRAPAVDSLSINRFIDRVEARLRQLPPPFVGHITGDTVLIGRTMDEIAWGQAVSLTGATWLIYAIMAWYFRSFRIAFWALIPNILPVTVYFGTLGLTGVTLNIITSLVACVVLGVAVDDTIHFLVRYRDGIAKLGDERQAVIAALRGVARPTSAMNAALCVGLLVLAGSGLRHQVEFAVLSAATLGFAWLMDMTFTPALCYGLRMKVGAGRTASKKGAPPAGPGD
jgi:predicted RND superfamily exporter protein